MSGVFRLERAGDQFELVRIIYPEFRTEVVLNKPQHRLRRIKFISKKPKRSELRKIRKEAREHLENLVRMGE